MSPVAVPHMSQVYSIVRNQPRDLKMFIVPHGRGRWSGPAPGHYRSCRQKCSEVFNQLECSSSRFVWVELSLKWILVPFSVARCNADSSQRYRMLHSASASPGSRFSRKSCQGRRVSDTFLMRRMCGAFECFLLHKGFKV